MIKNPFIYFTVLTALMTFTYQLIPWWGVFAIPMIVGYIAKNVSSKHVIYLSALSAFIVWSGLSWYLADQNNYILSSKIGSLFGGLSSWHLIIFTGILGAFYAALGGFLGNSIRRWPKSQSDIQRL